MMGILESQLRARFGNLEKELREISKTGERPSFESIQNKYNKLVKDCIIIIAETIDNKCTPLPKNDFPKIKN